MDGGQGVERRPLSRRDGECVGVVPVHIAPTLTVKVHKFINGAHELLGTLMKVVAVIQEGAQAKRGESSATC